MVPTVVPSLTQISHPWMPSLAMKKNLPSRTATLPLVSTLEKDLTSTIDPGSASSARTA